MGEDFIPLSMKLITFHPFVKSIEHFEGMTVCDFYYFSYGLLFIVKYLKYPLFLCLKMQKCKEKGHIVCLKKCVKSKILKRVSGDNEDLYC